MGRFRKIIFVCTDNTAVSPMAEMICKNMLIEPDLEIISRGLVVLFPEPPNQKAEVVLINHGLSIEGRSAIPLEQDDIEDTTLILTMTREQKEKVSRDYEFVQSLYTLKGFIDEDGDVIDPYGGTLVDYEECYGEIARLIKKAVIKLKKIYGLKENKEIMENRKEFI